MPRSMPFSRPPSGLPRASSPDGWFTCLAPGTAGSWWRKCGRATGRSPVSTRSSSCRSRFTTKSSVPMANGRRCFSRTPTAWPSASCATTTSPRPTPPSSSPQAVATSSPSRSHRRFSNAAFALSPSSAASTPRPAAVGMSPAKNSKTSPISCSTPALQWAMR